MKTLKLKTIFFVMLVMFTCCAKSRRNPYD